MTINITAGDCLNDILSSSLEGHFVPFGEAMENGAIIYPLFSDEFVAARCKHHNVDEELYRSKLSGFIEFVKNPNIYSEVVLWFGDDDFCKANIKVVYEVLKEINYNGTIKENIVDEITGAIKTSKVIR